MNLTPRSAAEFSTFLRAQGYNPGMVPEIQKQKLLPRFSEWKQRRNSLPSYKWLEDIPAKFFHDTFQINVNVPVAPGVRPSELRVGIHLLNFRRIKVHRNLHIQDGDYIGIHLEPTDGHEIFLVKNFPNEKLSSFSTVRDFLRGIADHRTSEKALARAVEEELIVYNG